MRHEVKFSLCKEKMKKERKEKKKKKMVPFPPYWELQLDCAGNYIEMAQVHIQAQCIVTPINSNYLQLSHKVTLIHRASEMCCHLKFHH